MRLGMWRPLRMAAAMSTTHVERPEKNMTKTRCVAARCCEAVVRQGTKGPLLCIEEPTGQRLECISLCEVHREWVGFRRIHKAIRKNVIEWVMAVRGQLVAAACCW
jgi:hypothetical protein